MLVAGAIKRAGKAIGVAGFIVDQLGKLNNADTPERFAGRLDLQRLGLLGHSLGGASIAQFCHDDSRCKAAVDVDGALLKSSNVRRALGLLGIARLDGRRQLAAATYCVRSFFDEHLKHIAKPVASNADSFADVLIEKQALPVAPASSVTTKGQ
jgi:pimeloyl-ACP methyl ester carboxylesterase